MPSSLRFSHPASFPQTSPTPQRTFFSPPTKKQKMSITQTYYLANKVRSKLSKEARRGDHDLRLLVGHANLLDNLLLDLADADREQETWFNQSVNGAAKASEEPKHVQWADTIPEEAVEDEEDEEDWGLENSDNESDSDDEDIDTTPIVPLRRQSKSFPTVTTTEINEDMEVDEDMNDDEDMEDDENYEDELALTRTSSHPPELLHESDSESDDDSMPPSPPQREIPLDAFSEKQRQAIATTSFYQSIPVSSDPVVASLAPSEQASFFDDGFYLPQRSHHSNLVSTY